MVSLPADNTGGNAHLYGSPHIPLTGGQKQIRPKCGKVRRHGGSACKKRPGDIQSVMLYGTENPKGNIRAVFGHEHHLHPVAGYMAPGVAHSGGNI